MSILRFLTYTVPYGVTLATRYDNAPLRKATRTPQGFLKAPARVTRAGVFQYTRADGSTSHELRHPDDVFDSGSLASLASAPVTVDHPATPVTAANARDHMVGFGSESPRRDGDFVESALTITDAAAVARAELPRTDSAVLCEVSLGYTARIVPETGVYQGQRYDARQRDIRYNHIALGPKGWGRAGESVKLFASDSADPTRARTAVSYHTNKETETMEKKDNATQITPPASSTAWTSSRPPTTSTRSVRRR